MVGANFANWYRPEEGTFIITTRQPAVGSCLVRVSSGTVANRMLLAYTQVNVSEGAVYLTAAGVSVSATRPILPNPEFNCFGSAYSSLGVALSVNGGSISSQGPGGIPIVDRLTLGRDGTSTMLGQGHIRRIAYYPVRLTNAQIQALTAL